MSDPSLPRGPEAEEPGRSPAEAPELPAWARRARTGGDPLGDARLATFIGRKWEGTYQRKFAPFREDPTFVPTWNWSAFFAIEYWFLYRKLYLAFVAFFLLPGMVFRWLTGSPEQFTLSTMSDPANQSLVTMLLAVRLSTGLAAGGTANWLLFRRARAAITVVAQQEVPEPEATALVARLGGVNRTSTSLFLLLTVVLTFAQLRA